MNRTEAGLRAALQTAYHVGDEYPEAAVVSRIVAGAHAPRRGGGRTHRVGGIAAGVATIALGGLVILALLSTPRGATREAHPAARPSAGGQRTVRVTPWALGYGIGGGNIKFTGHDLPPNSKVDITVHQGAATTSISTTADAQGNADATIAEPAVPAPGWADLSVCVQPPGSAMTCFAQQVGVPYGAAAAPAPTPTCPPGTRETSRSTPAPNGSYWVGCIGSSSPSPP